MKRRIEDYTFDASEKTVTFVETQAIKLEGVMAIVNVTDGIIIYNPSDPALIGSASGKVLTLTYNTTTMSDTDDLLVLYDDSGSKTKKALINQTGAEGADVALIAAPGANKYIVLDLVSAFASGANTNNMELRMRIGATAATDDALSDNDIWHPGIPPGGGFVETQFSLEGPANTAFNFQCSDPGGETAIKALYHIMDLAENT